MILCFCRLAMGSAAPPHGISGGQSELQDYVSVERREIKGIEPAVRVRRFGLGQQLFMTIHVRHAHAVQQITNIMEVQDAENYCSLDCRGQVLLCINDRCGGFVSLSGETTSSDDENGPSTLISGSTSRMKSSGLSKSLPWPSWRIS